MPSSEAPVSVILLAAGYGTRLYPLTKDRPKALLSLGSEVIIDPMIKGVQAIPHVSRMVLVTNHCFAAPFEAWRQQRHLDLDIVDDGTSTPETRCGAIRDLLLSLERVEAHDDILVLGTDNLFRWSLADFVASAQAHAPAPSIGVWQTNSRDEATRFGVVVLGREGRITQFVEKPADPPSRYVASCIYYFPAPMRGRIQEFVRQGGNADAPGFFIEWLVRQEATYGVVMQGAWFDIGTLETYRQAVSQWGARVGS